MGGAAATDGEIALAPVGAHPFVGHVRTVTVALFGLLATVSILPAFVSLAPSVAGFGLPVREILVVTSGSMAPGIHRGDAIAVRPVDAV